MPIKLNVGLSRKVGQPNYGSLGACCNVDIELDAQTLRDDPQTLHRRVQEAFAICRQAVAAELSQTPGDATQSRHSPESGTTQRSRLANTESSSSRAATQSQIRAIHAIARKAGIVLASELERHFGVTHPNQLTLRQASQLIDSMKQDLAPSTV